MQLRQNALRKQAFSIKVNHSFQRDIVKRGNYINEQALKANADQIVLD
jgi:hypothetical protein